MRAIARRLRGGGHFHNLSDMDGFLRGVLGIAIPLFAIASMASVGLGHDLREVTRPLRRPAMVATALIANFVAVPLLGLLLLQVFPLEPADATGLLLVSCAAGASFLLALTHLARADIAMAGGLLVLLVPFTLLYLPIVLPLALPGAIVDVGAIAWNLGLTMLLPFVLGVAIRLRSADFAQRQVPPLRKIAMTSLVVLMLATLLANLDGVVAMLGTAAVPAVLLLILGAMAIGYVLGIPVKGSRVVLALGTAQRNIAAAMIVATSGFPTPEPLVIVVVTALMGFAVLFPAAWFFRRHLERHEMTGRVRFATPAPGWFGRGRRA